MVCRSCGPTIYAKSGVVQRVQEALGERCAGLFSGVMPHSPVEVLDEAVAMATDLAPDVIISVGGGSTSDRVTMLPKGNNNRLD